MHPWCHESHVHLNLTLGEETAEARFLFPRYPHKFNTINIVNMVHYLTLNDSKSEYMNGSVLNLILRLCLFQLPYFMNELTLTELDMGSATPRILRASKPSVDYRGKRESSHLCTLAQWFSVMIHQCVLSVMLIMLYVIYPDAHHSAHLIPEALLSCCDIFSSTEHSWVL